MAIVQPTVYGIDLSYDSTNLTGFQVGPNSDYQEATETTNLRNWILHCLITEKGEYKPRPNYGVGILSKVKQKAFPDVLRAIQTDIITNLLNDVRISKVDVTVSNQIINGLNVLMVTIFPEVNGQKVSIPPFQFFQA